MAVTRVKVHQLTDGTDGELITWSSTGAPTTVAVGTAGHVLTSNGVGAAPTFQAAPVAEATTASNGLNLSTLDVRLGGSLTSVTTITGNTTNYLIVTGARTAADAGSLVINNTSASGPALKTLASGTGAGVWGESTTGTGIYGSSGSISVGGYSTGTIGTLFTIEPTSTNTIAQGMVLDRNTTGTAADGIGNKIFFRHETSTSANQSANSIVSKWATATHASRLSEISFTGYNIGTENTLLSLLGTGKATLNKYGVGTFTGTAAYTLQVDSSGNIIEGTVSGGSGGSGDISNGGNTTGADITIGTNDAFDLNLEANGVTALTVANGGNIGIGTTTPTTGKLEVVAGTLSSESAKTMYVTGTNPSVLTGIYNQIDYQLTSAGSSDFGNGGINIDYLPGYTGINRTTAVRANNAALSTGTSIVSFKGNWGFNAGATGVTTGTNIAGVNIANNGNINIGTFSYSNTLKNGAANIGSVSLALNTGTTPTQVGGYFGLQNTDPTFESAALIADNGSTTDPIFLARDNGTTVMSIVDDGKVGIGTDAPALELDIRGTTASTNTAKNQLSISNSLTTGIVAAGFGTRFLFRGTANNVVGGNIPSVIRDIASIEANWRVATDATRSGNIVFSLVKNGGALTQYLKLSENASGELILGAGSATVTLAPANLTTTTAFTLGNSNNACNISSSMNSVAAVTLNATSNTTTASGTIGQTTFTTTGGTKYDWRFSSGYTVTSGSGGFYNILVNPTINQTVSAGATGFMDIAPTLTNISGGYNVFNCAVSNANVKFINQTGSLTTNTFVGKTFFGASTAPTALLQTAPGTTSVAPLKIGDGPAVTTAQANAVENDKGLLITKSSGLRYMTGGSIKDFYTDASNTGTSETDLYSHTTPANTLDVDGQKLTARFSGIFSDITATGRLRCYFGGSNIFDSGALTLTSSTGNWDVELLIIRSSATTVRVIVTATAPGASTSQFTTQSDVGGLTLTGTNILKITGTAGGAGGGTGDITAKLGVIKWFGAAND